jgi:signal transduction histidine kinase
MTSAEPPPPVRPKAQRMRWHQLYYLLAAFDLVTISCSLYLNHRLMDIHDESVRINQEWAGRLNLFSDLAQVGGEVNAPGNDVFDSRDVKGESARLRAALTRFEQRLGTAEVELFNAVVGTRTNDLREDLALVRLAMQEMVEEADLIFSYFRQNQPEKAGERMATMDRKYAKLNGGFAQLGRHIREIQAGNFRTQQTDSAVLRRYEYLIAGAILFMVLAVTGYGHRMARVMNTLMQEKERSVAALHETQAGLERHVRERTSELRAEISRRERAQRDAEDAQEKLLESSRRAGMAEVATGVLHNVGNVLNSVNISASQIATQLRQSSAGDVARVVELFRQNEGQLGEYLTANPKGRQIPAFLGQLADALEQERRTGLKELESLTANIDHIKHIISMQQGLARSSGVRETVAPADLFEQALVINLASLERHQIDVIREFGDLAPIETDRHLLLQILVNLIGNAKYAMLKNDSPVKRLTLRALADPARPGFVLLQVRDTGLGIKQEHLSRIFNQGFTTKKDGHGFGLHSGALAAKQMGGTLEVHSDGEGCGATFTVCLPASTNTNTLQAAA